MEAQTCGTNPKPDFISQTVMPGFGHERRHPGHPPKVAPSPAATTALERAAVDGDVARDRVRAFSGLHQLKAVDPRFAGPEVGASQPDPGVDRLVADDEYGVAAIGGKDCSIADGPAKSDPEGWLVKRGS